MSAVVDAARAIKRRQDRQSRRDRREMRYAEVKNTKPLKVRLTDGNLDLDDEDLVFGQLMGRYDAKHGVERGDTLAVTQMANGEWMVVDVIGGDKAPAPDAPERDEPKRIEGNYTLKLKDGGGTIEVADSGAVDITVPSNGNEPFRRGTRIEIVRMGEGEVTIKAAASVVLRSKGGKAKIDDRYGQVRLRKRGNNEWVLTGDLA